VSEVTKKKWKKAFHDALKAFCDSLTKHVSTDTGEWTIKGFIDVFRNVYTISSDTKIISKILEIHLFPLILKFAEDQGFKVVPAEKQNWYPDLTFISKENESIKFALDIKTTYRKDGETAGFTLGSHGKYFIDRSSDKNIQFPYSEYLGHYCIGIVYTRVETEAEDSVIAVKDLDSQALKEARKKVGPRKVTQVDNLKSIVSVIKDFDFFVAEKWKIASDKRGSGNTANIGSISDLDQLKAENGPFSVLGEQMFDEYWMNYDKVSRIVNGRKQNIRDIESFLKFRKEMELLKKLKAWRERKAKKK